MIDQIRSGVVFYDFVPAWFDILVKSWRVSNWLLLEGLATTFYMHIQ